MIKKVQHSFHYFFYIMLVLLVNNCAQPVTKIDTPPKLTQNTKRTSTMIQDEVNRHKQEVKRLHRQLVVDGKAFSQGFITFRLVIRSSGEVSEVTVIRNTFGDELAAVMTATIKKWKFDEVIDPNDQIVELPYAFTEQTQ